MKKLLFVAILLATACSSLKAQNDTVFYVSQIPNGAYLYLCPDRYDRAIIYAENGCNDFWWRIHNDLCYDNPIIIENTPYNHTTTIVYGGCGIDYMHFTLYWYLYGAPTETTHEYWKRPFENLSLEAVGVDSISTSTYEFNYSFLWSTGATTYNIDVAEPGTYTCEISSPCFSVTRTFIVRDNVEIYRAGVDLRTGFNRPTWRTTPAQAEYISEVKVERDGFVVGTVPYEQGYFLDNIGSENAARTYKLTGILYDGTECPIPSYQKGTPHVDYSPNASNPNKLNMAWTPPYIEEGAPVSIAYFQICRYSSETDEITVIDQIGANNTIASYDNNLFEGGYAVLGVLFDASKDYEEVSFSNMSEDILAVDEQQISNFRIYPNPAKDRVTVEGTGILTVTNALGQTILTKEIDGKTTMDLPQGMYFMNLNGTVRKIVVE